MGQQELPGEVTPQLSSEGFIDVGQWERNYIFSSRLLKFALYVVWGASWVFLIRLEGRQDSGLQPCLHSAQTPLLLINEPRVAAARMCQTQHLEQAAPWGLEWAVGRIKDQLHKTVS